MTTPATPAAPSTIEPRTPTPYRAIGAGTLSAAALLIITLAAIMGGDPDPVTIRQALTASILLLAGGGFWALGLHRHRVMYDLAEERAAARHEVVRQDLRDFGAMALRSSGRRELQDIAIALDKVSTQNVHLLMKRAEADQAQKSLQQQVAQLAEQQETLAAMLAEQRGGRLILQIPNQEIYDLGKKVGGEQRGHDQTS